MAGAAWPNRERCTTARGFQGMPQREVFSIGVAAQKTDFVIVSGMGPV